MEQINITKLLTKQEPDSFDTWLEVSLLNLMSSIIMNNDQKGLVKNEDGDNIAKIELKINGVDVSFKGLLRRWHNAFDDQVRRKVKKIIPNTVSDAVTSIEDKTNDFLKMMGEKMQSFTYDFENILIEIIKKAAGHGPE